MTPQEVIKALVNKLANHGYTASNSYALDGSHPILDSAVRASSRFNSMADVIESLNADRINVERIVVEAAVTTALGEDYFNAKCKNEDGTTKLLEELDAETLAFTYEDSTIKEWIEYTSAKAFLQWYCGIYLDNDDTGAITGSDANLKLSAASYGASGEKILVKLKEKYGDKATLSDDGQTLTIGTGVEKNANSIVPENFNTYNASNNIAQNIDTGSKIWVVNATNKADTITSNGEDYINAGDGNDVITANADGATISTGLGKDKVTVSASVKQLKITDLSKNDELTIQGTFEVGSAKVEDNMTLVITDKTGTRKLTLAQFQADTKVNIGNASTTLGQWLADFKDWDWSTATESAGNTSVSTTTVKVNLDEVSPDSSGNIVVDKLKAGKLSNSYPDLDTFTVGGLTLHLRGTSTDIACSDPIPITFDDLDDDQKIIIGGLFKWWLKESVKLNEESFGLNFNDADVKDIDLYFFYDENASLAAVISPHRDNYDGINTALYLNINLEPYQNVSADNVDGWDGIGEYLDRTLAHEFNHAVLAANVNYFTNLPKFFKEGLAELTHGIDDARYFAILGVASDRDLLASQLNLNDLSNASTQEMYSAGYIFLRYFATQAATQTLALPALLPAFGEITANVDLSKFKIGDTLYCDDKGNVATAFPASVSSVLLGEVIDDSKIGGSGGDAAYLVIDSGVKQIIHTADNNYQVVGLTSNTELVGSKNDEYVEIYEGANVVNTGSGEDFIRLTGQYATINTGEGNDTVFLFDGGHNSIDLGDGDNYLEILGEPAIDNIGLFSYLYNNSITAGTGNDTLSNPSVRYFNEDYYEVSQDYQGAQAYNFDGFHFDYNIDLGDGDNKVDLTALVNSSLKTGEGNDVISVNVLKNSTVNTGAGNDIVSISGSENIIDMGAGENALVYSGGSDTTIKTAEGTTWVSLNAAIESSLTLEDFGEDDGILLAKDPEIFKIEDGKLVVDNVIITGISAIATFEPDIVTDSNHVSLIQNITEGALLSVDKEKEDFNITYSAFNGTATIFTITGLNSDDYIELDKKDYTKIIVTKEALAHRTANKITVSEGFTLVFEDTEDDVLMISEATDAKFENGIYTAATTAEYCEKDDEGAIVYHKAKGGQQFKLEGINENATLDKDIVVGEDGKVTVMESALPDDISKGAKVTLTDLKAEDGVDYTLTFEEDIPQDTAKHAGGWEGSDGTFTYTEDYKHAHWAKSGNTYTFNEQTGGHQFKLSGFDSTLTADNFKSSTVSVKSGTDGFTFKILKSDILPKAGAVSIEGVTGIDNIEAKTCTLALDSNKVAAPKAIVESFKSSNGKYTYTAEGTSAGWSLVDGKITYSAQVGGEQFELSGIKGSVKLNNGVKVADKVVTVSTAALNTSEKDGAKIQLTSDAGYTLNLDENILQTDTKVEGAFTEVKSGKATYTATHNLSYYEQTDLNTFTYRKKDAPKKIYISNLKKAATLADTDAITITENGNNKFNVAFEDDKILDAKSPSVSTDKGVTYTVEVADKLKPVLQPSDWKVSGTNASLKSDTSAGYDTKNNKVVYTKLQTGKPQVILAGTEKNLTASSFTVPAGETLTINAKTLGAKGSIKSNTNNLTVEVTGDMKGKTFNGTNLNDTLQVSSSNGSIYGGNGNDEFTVTGDDVTLIGGKGNDNFTVGKNSVIAFNKGDGLDTVTYGAGLKISLSGTNKPDGMAQSGSNLIINFGKNDSITVTNMGDTLSVVNTKEKFTLDKSKADIGKSLTFDAKSTSVTIAADFTGTVSPDDDIYLSSGKISKVSTINASKVTGEVFIVGNTKANTILGGKNSSVKGDKGNDIFVYGGGKLTITDYAAGDKISLGSATYKDYSISGDDVILNFGDSNSMTIKDSAGKAITIVEGKTSIVNIYAKEGIFNSGKTAATISGSSLDATSYPKLVTISSASDNDIKINGNAKANVIIGGKGNDSLVGDTGNDKLFGNAGNDTLWGGAGTDTLDGGTGNDTLWGGSGNDMLTGGEGNDTFIYSPGEGKDTITDYKNGDMLKILDSTFTKSTYNNGTLTLTIDGGGTVTFKNVASSTEFNINGKTHKINGKILE